MKNYGTTNIWYTPNGGTNWYSIEGNLPDMPVHTILQNPLRTSELMIGTELGVWHANTFDPDLFENQSLVWKQSYNGMSGVKVTDLDLQPNLPSPSVPTGYNVFAATYGRGIFSGQLTPRPVNDDCLNATALNVETNFATAPTLGLILGATASEVSAPSIPAPGCAGYLGGDVWYSAIVPSNGQLTFETGSIIGGITNSGLAIYSGACGTLTKIACDDDSSADGLHSLISVTGRTPGEVLYARVWSFNNLLTLVSSDNNSPTSKNITAAGSGQFKIAAYSSLLNTASFDLEGFKLYPNPIKDKLTLSYTKEISDISIHNITGQEVRSIKHINTKNIQIDMSNLSSGSYLLKVNVDGLENILKVIKE